MCTICDDARRANARRTLEVVEAEFRAAMEARMPPRPVQPSVVEEAALRIWASQPPVVGGWPKAK